MGKILGNGLIGLIYMDQSEGGHPPGIDSDSVSHHERVNIHGSV